MVQWPRAQIVGQARAGPRPFAIVWLLAQAQCGMSELRGTDGLCATAADSCNGCVDMNHSADCMCTVKQRCKAAGSGDGASPGARREFWLAL